MKSKELIVKLLRGSGMKGLRESKIESFKIHAKTNALVVRYKGDPADYFYKLRSSGTRFNRPMKVKAIRQVHEEE